MSHRREAHVSVTENGVALQIYNISLRVSVLMSPNV